MPPLDVSQTFAQARAHHQTGDLRTAETLYRAILIQEPGHSVTLHLLAVLLAQSGRREAALELANQILAYQPAHVEALNTRGNLLREMGRLEEAVAAYRTALGIKPELPITAYNLGNALKDLQRCEEAAAAYIQALACKPDFALAHYNLANTLKDLHQYEKAIGHYQQALALQPNQPEIYNNLSSAQLAAGHAAEAAAAARQAVTLQPDFALAHNNLANALADLGNIEEAAAAYRRAIALQPNFPEAHSNLGTLLIEEGYIDEAIAAHRHALALTPDYPEAHNNLGFALKRQGLPDEAIAAYRHAISLKPNFPEAYSNLGNALKDMGQLDEASAAYRRAITLRPGFHEAHSNLILTLLYDVNCDAPTLARELRQWNNIHAAPLQPLIQPHANDRDPDRPLRIGYVSADFRDHVVGRNLLPLFRLHDRQQFNITCYAHVPRPDDMTRLFQQHADGWRSIVGLTDAQVAGQIRADQIDLLIDLSLHSARHRLLIFARKPAPVQATFAGYPGSTGLTTIDYRLSDPFLDPPDADASSSSEQTIRLPETFWCYDPLENADLSVNALPAATNHVITFGSLNNFCKINENVLRLWAQVLRTIPASRLLLRIPAGSVRQKTLHLLEQEGIAASRTEFIPPQPRRQYLESYHRIDIGLDTLPYNGHTTSLDSFWMGVPVITLVGQTVVGRAGLSQLMNLNLPDLIAHTPAQFVQIATDLACDLPRLAHLRSTLRQRMQQSPLMDAPRLTRHIEAAYRERWRNYCAA